MVEEVDSVYAGCWKLGGEMARWRKKLKLTIRLGMMGVFLNFIHATMGSQTGWFPSIMVKCILN